MFFQVLQDFAPEKMQMGWEFFSGFLLYDLVFKEK